MFKRVPWFSLAGVTLFLILAMAFLPLIRGKERRLKVENFHLITHGMTLKEVEELLGGPPGNYGFDPAGSSMATLEGIMEPPGSVEKRWFNQDNMFEIYFDAKDEVVAAHKRTHFKQFPQQSWLAKLGNYLRGLVYGPQPDDRPIRSF